MTCYFCKLNTQEIDFQNSDLLTKFLTGWVKMKKQKKTRLCAKHHRELTRAIKRARYMGLLPYIIK